MSDSGGRKMSTYLPYLISSTGPLLFGEGAAAADTLIFTEVIDGGLVMTMDDLHKVPYPAEALSGSKFNYSSCFGFFCKLDFLVSFQPNRHEFGVLEIFWTSLLIQVCLS